MFMTGRLIACAIAFSPTIGLGQFNPSSPRVLTTSIDCDDMLDASAVGHAVFVFRRSQLQQGELAHRGLSELIPVDRAEVHGRPGREVRALIAHMLGTPHELHVREVCASIKETPGFIWKVTWELFPARGGSTGTPYESHAFVNPDGSVLTPERFLCDHMYLANGNEEYYFGGGHGVFSALAIADIGVKADDTTVHGDKVLSLAKAALDRFVEENFEASKGPNLRFHDQSLIDLPIDTDRNAQVVKAKVWAVNFIEADLAREEINQSDPFTVWVTTDGLVSQLSLHRWKPVRLRTNK